MNQYTKKQFRGLIDALVDLAEIFRVAPFLTSHKVVEVLQAHHIPVVHESELANIIPITPEILSLLSERAQAIDDWEHNKMSDETLDHELHKIAAAIMEGIKTLVDQDNVAADGEVSLHTKPSENLPISDSEKPRPQQLAAQPATADDILYMAREHILQRAVLRDCPDGERSMAATIAAFNAIYNHQLTETEGWQFMVLLKMVRGNQGSYHRDDYEDQTGFSALAGESAGKESNSA